MLRSPALHGRTASALNSDENERRSRRLAVFVGLSVEHSLRAFSPIWVSTKVKQAQTLGRWMRMARWVDDKAEVTLRMEASAEAASGVAAIPSLRSLRRLLSGSRLRSSPSESIGWLLNTRHVNTLRVACMRAKAPELGSRQGPARFGRNRPPIPTLANRTGEVIPQHIELDFGQRNPRNGPINAHSRLDPRVECEDRLAGSQCTLESHIVPRLNPWHSDVDIRAHPHIGTGNCHGFTLNRNRVLSILISRTS